MWTALGIWIPDQQVCPHHSSPLDAFACAYFAGYEDEDGNWVKAPRVVWKGSRGLAGKTVLLATLSLTEALTLGAGVTLLGGSGEQATRIHRYYDGTDPNMQGRFWQSPMAREYLQPLLTKQNVREAALTNGGYIYALMASQKSVRGPHPQRLRGDEIDEMDQSIWDAAQGQPMSDRGIPMQTLGSSTHQNPNGTMTRELHAAAENGWPVFEWCYRETLQPEGWLSEEEVELKRSQIPVYMWNTEYELQEPAVEGRAVAPGFVEKLFSLEPPCRGGLGEKYYFEEPVEGGQYAIGADWGKKKDKTIIIVMRTDVKPMRVVAFFHLGRQPWPVMIGAFNSVVSKYKGVDEEASKAASKEAGKRVLVYRWESEKSNVVYAAHDNTGLGTVVDDYMEHETEPVTMVGKNRSDLFSSYIVSIENEEWVAPRIEYMMREHKTCTVDDLYRSGEKYHPPDTFVGGAMAYRAATSGTALFY